MNSGDFIVLAVVAAAVFWAAARIVRNRRKGKSACGCDCIHCSCECGTNPRTEKTSQS